MLTPLTADILNYALTLEHLEATFYEQGLKNYTEEDFKNAGLDSTFYANLKMIASDEKTHEEFLTQALTSTYLTTYQAWTSGLRDYSSCRCQARGTMRLCFPVHRCEKFP